MQRKKPHDVFQKIVDPDNELLLWEQWIKIRNDEVIKLAEHLNKPPADLTMNLVEKVREKKEWKTVLEHAQIKEKPTVRGHLWEQPVRLHQPCYCKQAYEVKRTAAEKGKPHVIEHICVPPYIQQAEKAMFGTPERVEFEYLNADFKKYRNAREQELKEKIAKIDPFRPTECLMVRGRKPRIPPPKLPPLPNIIVTDSDKHRDLTLCTVYAVRINNTVILKDIPGQDLSCLEKLKQEIWYEPCVTWFYYFNNPFNKVGRCKLFLQNLGTVTLRYCWKKLKRPIPFIPEDIYEQVFFFQKNEDVLSPGQSKEIFFTFISDKPGIYCESWELSFCNICFFDNMSNKLCINLCGDAVENAEKIQRKFEILQNRIELQAVTNLVTSLINEIFIKATAVKPQEYPYKHYFVEAELFVMKNPVCFYHQSQVNLMKNQYSEMTKGRQWDLSITSWREAMIKQEFENRMNYYDSLKNSHADLLIPWYEGEELSKEKHRAVKQILGQMADRFDRKYNALIRIHTSIPTSDVSAGDGLNSPRSRLDIDQQTIRNMFYIHAYDYVCTAVETCAGILSSLDLNRWIEFDFCQI